MTKNIIKKGVILKANKVNTNSPKVKNFVKSVRNKQSSVQGRRKIDVKKLDRVMKI